MQQREVTMFQQRSVQLAMAAVLLLILVVQALD
jgi:hypothetical protein